jgi:DNA-directed RNA polymerase specialized sigma24 family protein
MRRPRQTTLNPDFLESGNIGAATAVHEQYFSERPEPTLRIVIDQVLQRVTEPQKSALEMCVMKRMTYKEASEWFTSQRGIDTDPKTVWRWAQQGVEQMGRMLAGAAWASAFVPNIPEPDDE